MQSLEISSPNYSAGKTKDYMVFIHIIHNKNDLLFYTNNLKKNKNNFESLDI